MAPVAPDFNTLIEQIKETVQLMRPKDRANKIKLDTALIHIEKASTYYKAGNIQKAGINLAIANDFIHAVKVA